VQQLPPEPPPEVPWWDDPWPAVLAGVLGLIAGGLIGFAVGDNRHTVTEAQRGGGEAVPSTVTRTATVVRPKRVVRTHTVTATVTQPPAPGSLANERRRHEAES